MMSVVIGPKWSFYSYIWIFMMLGQVMYPGRAPCTKEALPDFHEWCRVTRHPLVFRVLTGSQRTPKIWGVTCSTSIPSEAQYVSKLFDVNSPALSILIPLIG